MCNTKKILCNGTEFLQGSSTYEIPRLHCNPTCHCVNKDPTIRPYPESDEYSALALLFEMHFIILFVPVRIILTWEQ